MARVAGKVSDGRVLQLLQSYLRQGVLEEATYWTPEQGTPQGGVVSPLLSNIYLDPRTTTWRPGESRWCETRMTSSCYAGRRAMRKRALAEVQRWTMQAELALHPEKTRIVDATQRGGFEFLGYHFERGMKWPRAKSLGEFKTTVRHHTRRHNPTLFP